MFYINITAAARDALVAWKPEAIQAIEPAPGGGFNLSLFGPTLQQQNALQRPDESYSDMIIRASKDAANR
jgi:hypothetical protein